MLTEGPSFLPCQGSLCAVCSGSEALLLPALLLSLTAGGDFHSFIFKLLPCTKLLKPAGGGFALG